MSGGLSLGLSYWCLNRLHSDAKLGMANLSTSASDLCETLRPPSIAAAIFGGFSVCSS